MVEPWEIQLLGGLSARQGSRTVSRFRTQKTGALLAFLAMRGGRVLPREVLLEILWPESDLAAARNSLSVALSSLRAQLEPPVATPGESPLGSVLIADRSTVTLNPDAFTTDVAAFEVALQIARGSGGDTTPLIVAINRYTGELLPGLYDDWVLSERERLADAYRDALRRLTARLIETGHPDTALDYAHRGVQSDPLGEESRRLLMRVYADLGQPAAVREQLKELERLREEAGEVPPTAETRWLALRLAENSEGEKGSVVGVGEVVRGPWSVVREEDSASPDTRNPMSSGRATDHGPRTTSPTPTTDHGPRLLGNLPRLFTRFFGRGEEIERLTDLISDRETRLVTLLGPGGCGKTRLAIEAARQAGEAFAAGGVWFVPLAAINDPAEIATAVREALRLPRVANVEPLEQIASHLGDQSALLVLDNMEHLLGRGALDPVGATASVRALQRRLPGITLLVTSREVLGIAGEVSYPVPLLPVPSDALPPTDLLNFASVQLFADRARNRRPDFQVTPRNAEAVAGLVARLEGFPLAIELAAAWSGLLTPAQMRERLAQRFELLVSRRADIPERHRTLRATVEWGYALLSPDAQRLFAALSVFRGDWSLEAAEAVCEGEGGVVAAGRTMECLSLLRNASFLVADEDSDEMRFHLLETLREFGDEQLTPEERDRLEQRHAAYYQTLAEDAYRNSHTSDQRRWFDRLETELANIRVALERFVNTETGLRIAASLGYFWKLRGYYREGRAWLDRVLSIAGAGKDEREKRIRGAAFNAAGFLADDMGDYAAAHRFSEQSAEMFRGIGDEPGLAMVLTNRGNISYRQGDCQTARVLYTQALEIYKRISHTWGIASILGSLGNVAQKEGDFTAARQLQEESLRISREIGDARMTAYTLHNLGNLAGEEGDNARARRLYEESLVGKRALGDRRGVASLQNYLGHMAIEEGHLDEAAILLTEALRDLLELGNRPDLVVALEGLAWLASVRSEAEQAARLWAATITAREQLGTPLTGEELSDRTLRIHAARAAATSPATFDAAWTEGHKFTLNEAARCALAHIEAQN